MMVYTDLLLPQRWGMNSFGVGWRQTESIAAISAAEFVYRLYQALVAKGGLSAMEK